MKLLVSYYLAYSSSLCSFFPFLMTSTVVGDGRIVVADIFLASFFGFFASLCLKSRLPIVTPLLSMDYKDCYLKFSKEELLCKVG